MKNMNVTWGLFASDNSKGSRYLERGLVDLFFARISRAYRLANMDKPTG